MQKTALIKILRFRRNKSIYKVFSLILAALLFVSLAACASSPSSTPDISPSENSTSSSLTVSPSLSPPYIPIDNNIQSDISDSTDNIENTTGKIEFPTEKQSVYSGPGPVGKDDLQKELIKGWETTFGIDFNDVASIQDFNNEQINLIAEHAGIIINEDWAVKIIQNNMTKISNIIHDEIKNNTTGHADMFEYVMLVGLGGEDSVPQYEGQIHAPSQLARAVGYWVFHGGTTTISLEEISQGLKSYDQLYSSMVTSALYQKDLDSVKVYLLQNVEPQYQGDGLEGKYKSEFLVYFTAEGQTFMGFFGRINGEWDLLAVM